MYVFFKKILIGVFLICSFNSLLFAAGEVAEEIAVEGATGAIEEGLEEAGIEATEKELVDTVAETMTDVLGDSMESLDESTIKSLAENVGENLKGIEKVTEDEVISKMGGAISDDVEKFANLSEEDLQGIEGKLNEPNFFKKTFEEQDINSKTIAGISEGKPVEPTEIETPPDEVGTPEDYSESSQDEMVEKLNNAQKEFDDSQENLTKAKEDFEGNQEKLEAKKAEIEEELKKEGLDPESDKYKDEYEKRLKDSQEYKDHEESMENYENAQKQLKKTQSDLDEVKDELSEKGPLKDGVKKKLKGLAKEKSKKFLWEKPSSFFVDLPKTMIDAVLFMVPGMIEQSIMKELQREALFNLISSEVDFAGIKMKIPSGLLNSSEPEKSVFLYQATHESENDKAVRDLYVADSDYGPWGQTYIQSPQFNGRLINLNTGYEFVASGEPFDEEKPVKPLLEGGRFGGSSVEEFLNSFDFKVSEHATGEEASGIIDASEHRLVHGDWAEKGMIGGYKYANLFEPGKDGHPHLIEGILAEFKKEKKIGSYNGKDVTASELIGLDEDLKKMSDKRLLGLPRDYSLVGEDIYIYQSANDPFADKINNNTDVKATTGTIYDYIVFLNESLEIVPMEIPGLLQDKKEDYYVGYMVNPKIKYIYSLIFSEKTKLVFEIENGKIKRSQADIKDFESAVYSLKQKYKSNILLENQLQIMSNFIWQKYLSGPFYPAGSASNIKLILDPDFLKSNLYIYKLDKSECHLEGEKPLDDYLIAVKVNNGEFEVVKLPRDDVDYYISLITSHFYSVNHKKGLFEPCGLSESKFNKPHPLKNAKAICSKQCTKKGNKKSSCYCETLYVKTDVEGNSSLVDAKTENAYAITWPVYSLYIAPEINPYNIGQNPFADMGFGLLKSTTKRTPELPLPSRWALETEFKIGKSHRTIQQWIDSLAPQSAKIKDLKQILEKNFESWKKKYTSQSWEAHANMGPFEFVKDTIYFSASSINDIYKGIYIYKSSAYPGEYLIMSEDSKKFDKGLAGGAFSGQPFAVSLSSGYVYSKKLKGERIPGAYVSLDKLKQFYEGSIVEKDIELSQQYFKNLGRKEEYPIYFGQFILAIDRKELDRQQYIYAKVNGLEKKKGGTIAGFSVKDIEDYFVCMQTNKDKTGYDFAVKFDAQKTVRIVSLISEAIYDIQGYRGAIVMNKGLSEVKDTSEPVVTKEFYKQIMSIIRDRSKGHDIRLEPIIKKLYEKYDPSELTEAEEKWASMQLIPDLTKAGIKETLDTLPYIGGAYPKLKLLNGKYYLVSEYATAPELKVSKNKTYLDFYYPNYFKVMDKKGNIKTEPIGVLYDKNGVADKILRSYFLEATRGFYGVYVSKDGKQKLKIPSFHPNISVKKMVPLNVSKSWPGYKGDFYTNKETGGFYCKITNNNNKNWIRYIDLATGNSYTADGKPSGITQTKTGNIVSTNTLPIAKSKDGSMLLIGSHSGTTAFSINYQDKDSLFYNKLNYDTDSCKTYTICKLNSSLIKDVGPMKKGDAANIYAVSGTDLQLMVYESLPDKRTYTVCPLNECAVGLCPNFKSLETYSISDLKYSSLSFVRYYDKNKKLAKPIETYSALNIIRKNNNIDQVILWKNGEWGGVSGILYKMKKKLENVKLDVGKVINGYEMQGKYNIYDYDSDTNKTKTDVIKIYEIIENDTGTEFIRVETSDGGSVDFIYKYKGLSTKALDNFKVNVWKLDFVPDYLGNVSLVERLGLLQSISGVELLDKSKNASDPTKIYNVPPEFVSEIKSSMQKLKYEPHHKRYLYELSEDDRTKYGIKGNYVDLKRGFLFGVKDYMDRFPMGYAVNLDVIIDIYKKCKISILPMKQKNNTVEDRLVFRSVEAVKKEEKSNIKF